MNVSRLTSIPRLCARSLDRLLSGRAAVTCNRVAPLAVDGRAFGCVEQVVWSRDKVLLRGWTTRPGLVAGLEEQARVPVRAWTERVVTPHADRPLPQAAGFEVSLDRPNAAAAVILATGAETRQVSLRLAPPWSVREELARVAALPGVLRHAMRHGSDILRFLTTGDPGLSVALRDAFGFGEDPDKAPIVPCDVFSIPNNEPARPQHPVVVIVPVHDAPDDVRRLLSRLNPGNDVDHRILLVDDGSENPAILPMLTEFATRYPDRVRLETLAENRGFVAAVNHGLSLAGGLGEHVILLNTDTLPPDGWIGRLIAPIIADPDVASVTPLSNTAEIASVPAQGVETSVGEDAVHAIDAVASGLGSDWQSVEIPTGIGFAIAMNRRFLDLLGGFDPAFGRGYGEEVDWCRKAHAAGGKHILATSVFVGHRGGASFGSEEKRARLLASAQTIRARYPGYDGEVQTWASTSPHAIQRAVLTIPWLDAVSKDPVPVFIAHVLGGGAELALQRELQSLLDSGTPGAVVLRAGGSAPWRADVEGAGFRHSCRFADTETLMKFLAPLHRRRVVYSCGAGARDPRDIPDMLLRLADHGRHELDLRLHDYFPISPSYCLLDSHGRYRGVPDPADRDPAHNSPATGHRSALSLREWRGLWNDVAEQANRITAFSASSAEILTTAFPQAAGKIAVVPHAAPDTMPSRLDPGGSAIGVLGGINQAKGAEVLTALARLLRARKSPRKIVVIGGLDPKYRLPKPHRVTGPYDRKDIARLARHHDVGLWLIPSIWPETYSFATREALATGLPVLAFDLGAQAEAAGEAENGVVLNFGPADSPALADEIERWLARG